MIKTLLATLAFLMFTTTGWATTYYVDCNSGSDAHGGTKPSEAWLTIGKVNKANLVQPAKVLFKRGCKFKDKSLIVSASGTTYGAWGTEGNKPVIDAKGRNFAIKISRKQNVTIQDLRIKGWTQRGIFGLDSSNISILRNTISGGNDIEPSHGIQFKSGTLQPGIIVKGNTIREIGIEDKNTRFGFNGIMLQGISGCEVQFNDIRTKHVNAIRLQKGSGPELNDGCWVGGNVIENSEGGIVVNGSTNTKVWGNSIRNGAGGIAVGYGSDYASIINNHLENLDRAYGTWGFPAPTPWMWNGLDVNGAANGTATGNIFKGVFNHSIMIDNDGQDSNGWTLTNNVMDARKNTGTVLCLRIEGDVNDDITYTSDFNTCYPGRNTAVDYKDRFNPISFSDYQAVSGQDANSKEF